MPSIQSEARELIQAALDHLEEYKAYSLLTTPEDCEEFRRWAAMSHAPIKTPPPTKPLPPIKVPVVETVKQSPPIEKKEVVAEKKAPLIKHALLPIEEKIPVLDDAFLDLRKIWTKINANGPLFDELPNDEIAKKMASRWKTKNAVAVISILSYHESPVQKALLEQIAKAINILLAPAQIVQAEPIEKEKQWETFLKAESLKLTIACDYTLWQLSGLMQHYRENPTQKTRKLGSIPVFLLPDLSLYLKDPLLKRSLWKALCQTISS